MAATRARDLLVVPAVTDAPWDGWLAPLSPALYPAEPGAWQQATPASGCPPFERDGTRRRPERAPPAESGVRPGQHTNNPLPPLHLMPLKLNIRQHPTHQRPLHRPVIPQQLLNRLWHQRQVIPQQFQLLRMLKQRQHPIANQIDRRLMPGNQQ